jgi:hypothetical protein
LSQFVSHRDCSNFPTVRALAWSSTPLLRSGTDWMGESPRRFHFARLQGVHGQTAPLAGSFRIPQVSIHKERRPHEFSAGTKRKANGRNG